MSNSQEKRVTRSALVEGYRLDKVGRGPGQRARRKRGSYLRDQSVGGALPHRRPFPPSASNS